MLLLSAARPFLKLICSSFSTQSQCCHCCHFKAVIFSGSGAHMAPCHATCGSSELYFPSVRLPPCFSKVGESHAWCSLQLAGVSQVEIATTRGTDKQTSLRCKPHSKNGGKFGCYGWRQLEMQLTASIGLSVIALNIWSELDLHPLSEEKWTPNFFLQNYSLHDKKFHRKALHCLQTLCCDCSIKLNFTVMF